MGVRQVPIIPTPHRWAGWMAVSFAGGLALTTWVARVELLPGERRFLRWVLADVAPWLGWVGRALDSAFTDASATVIFAVLAVGVLAWRGWWAAVVFLVAGGLTALARLGNLVDRPRPTGRLEWDPAAAGPGGYPSGHVVYFVLIFGLLAYLGTTNLRPSVALILRGGAVLMMIVVGLSRLVRAEHWPADVLASYLLAVPALALVIRLYEHGPPQRLSGSSAPEQSVRPRRESTEPSLRASHRG